MAEEAKIKVKQGVFIPREEFEDVEGDRAICYLCGKEAIELPAPLNRASLNRVFYKGRCSECRTEKRLKFCVAKNRVYVHFECEDCYGKKYGEENKKKLSDMLKGGKIVELIFCSPLCEHLWSVIIEKNDKKYRIGAIAKKGALLLEAQKAPHNKAGKVEKIMRNKIFE